MDGKIELASPQWLAQLEQLVRAYSTKAGRALELSICEVFTDVPKHPTSTAMARCPGIAGSATEGRVRGRRDRRADIKTIADYVSLFCRRMKIEQATWQRGEQKLAEGDRRQAHSTR
jgi:hypothetical protein